LPVAVFFQFSMKGNMECWLQNCIIFFSQAKLQ